MISSWTSEVSFRFPSILRSFIVPGFFVGRPPARRIDASSPARSFATGGNSGVSLEESAAKVAVGLVDGSSEGGGGGGGIDGAGLGRSEIKNSKVRKYTISCWRL